MIMPNPSTTDPRVYVATRRTGLGEHHNNEEVLAYCVPTQAEANRLVKAATAFALPIGLPGSRCISPGGFYRDRDMNFGYCGGGPNALEDAILTDFFEGPGISSTAGAELRSCFGALFRLNNNAAVEYFCPDDVEYRSQPYAMTYPAHDLRLAVSGAISGAPSEWAGKIATSRVFYAARSDKGVEAVFGGITSCWGKSSFADAVQATTYLDRPTAVAFEAEVHAKARAVQAVQRRACDGYADGAPPLTLQTFVQTCSPLCGETEPRKVREMLLDGAYWGGADVTHKLPARAGDSDRRLWRIIDTGTDTRLAPGAEAAPGENVRGLIECRTPWPEAWASNSLIIALHPAFADEIASADETAVEVCRRIREMIEQPDRMAEELQALAQFHEHVANAAMQEYHAPGVASNVSPADVLREMLEHEGLPLKSDTHGPCVSFALPVSLVEKAHAALGQRGYKAPRL